MHILGFVLVLLFWVGFFLHGWGWRRWGRDGMRFKINSMNIILLASAGVMIGKVTTICICCLIDIWKQECNFGLFAEGKKIPVSLLLGKPVRNAYLNEVLIWTFSLI